ncbi:MAG: putative Rdx family selenoprotein [Cellvibrionaceae bacterium]|jgi:predicted Rdx family selenoprotein
MKLIPGKGGKFELVVNGELAYSKKATGRHAEEGEVLKIFAGIVGPDVPKYHD